MSKTYKNGSAYDAILEGKKLQWKPEHKVEGQLLCTISKVEHIEKDQEYIEHKTDNDAVRIMELENQVKDLSSELHNLKIKVDMNTNHRAKDYKIDNLLRPSPFGNPVKMAQDLAQHSGVCFR